MQMVVDDPGPGRAEVSSVFAEALGLVLAGQARELTVRLVRAPGSRNTTASWRRRRAELSPAASTELTALFDRIVHRTACPNLDSGGGRQ
ncbi:hypothetical protein ABZ370_43415 [Streptomyces sp. NPDC005962]|uniref:hypothetical protein n=1 Tax=Streptomyces sp. NPDC005962 TaxID=3154466 RepID=UPI0033DF102C